jgi:chromosomal replication initiator protein
MLAMYVCRVELGASFAEIGAAFGNRDHTTVMSAVRKIQDLVDSDDAQVLADIGRLGKL